MAELTKIPFFQRVVIIQAIELEQSLVEDVEYFRYHVTMIDGAKFTIRLGLDPNYNGSGLQHGLAMIQIGDFAEFRVDYEAARSWLERNQPSTFTLT